MVASGAQPDPGYWSTANGVLEYSFEANTAVLGKGTFQIYVRLMQGDTQVAITSVSAKFSGK